MGAQEGGFDIIRWKDWCLILFRDHKFAVSLSILQRGKEGVGTCQNVVE